MDYHSSLFPSCPPLRATSLSSSHALSLSLSRLSSFSRPVSSRLVSSRLVSSPSLSYFLHPAGLLPAVSCKKAHPTAGRSLSIPPPPLTKTCKAEWAKAGWWEWWLAERTKPKEESRGDDGWKKDGAALDYARNGEEGRKRERERERERVIRARRISAKCSFFRSSFPLSERCYQHARVFCSRTR